VRIFRVDNPHTKPFHFWEWLISGIKKDYPDVFFPAEAFTRPKAMYRLAKLGFSQSYNGDSRPMRCAGGLLHPGPPKIIHRLR
jgi:glycosidase